MTNKLIQKYSGLIHRFLVNRLQDDELAKDLTQDILLKIIRNESKLSSIENLDAWIYRVAQNRLIDQTRKKRESRINEDTALEAESSEEDFLDGINSCLEMIIREYDDTETELFLKVFSGEVSQKDAARQLGIPYSTLKSRVQKVRDDVFNRFLNECCSLIYNSEGEVINCRPISRNDACCFE